MPPTVSSPGSPDQAFRPSGVMAFSPHSKGAGRCSLDQKQKSDWFRAQPETADWFRAQPASSGSDAEISDWFKKQPANAQDDPAAIDWFAGKPTSSAGDAQVADWFRAKPKSETVDWFRVQPASSGSDAEIADWFKQQPACAVTDPSTNDWLRGKPISSAGDAAVADWFRAQPAAPDIKEQAGLAAAWSQLQRMRECRLETQDCVYQAIEDHSRAYTAYLGRETAQLSETLASGSKIGPFTGQVVNAAAVNGYYDRYEAELTKARTLLDAAQEMLIRKIKESGVDQNHSFKEEVLRMEQSLASELQLVQDSQAAVMEQLQTNVVQQTSHRAKLEQTASSLKLIATADAALASHPILRGSGGKLVSADVCPHTDVRGSKSSLCRASSIGHHPVSCSHSQETARVANDVQDPLDEERQLEDEKIQGEIFVRVLCEMFDRLQPSSEDKKVPMKHFAMALPEKHRKSVRYPGCDHLDLDRRVGRGEFEMIARALIPIIKPWNAMWVSRDQMVMRDNIVRVCKRYALCGLSSPPAHAPQSPEQAHGPLYYDGEVVA